MAKQSGLLKRQKEEQKKRERVLQDATRQTFVQYMTDTLLFTLNDPEVMGKDVFGYARLKKVLDALPLAEDVTENLGEYESEARAMEVLEDIARQYKHHTRTTQRNALMFAFEPPKVYEMPLE